ncbi:uncharacterized protein LOC113874674 [Abrus precatorius]|uniref:Uncharacterized protein LOC113874674 n=1 Tax=Abrus precatorius TaxID=3816 RepID=A0A8B8MLA4_ABRPR|nr:uncharacterized protein LOC113874674 [Abrus precatorius]
MIVLARKEIADKLNPKLNAANGTLVNRLKFGESGNSNVQQETEIGCMRSIKIKAVVWFPGLQVTPGMKLKRWSGCRKMRSRKCIYGQKIFTGPRQQELLSRLLTNMSEECHKKLLEVSKTFVEGKMLLEDYVFTLKASVGLKALVEGVGVGKGKEDLTGLTIDSTRSTQALPVRQEIPVGKACSMLAPSEIISFLTVDFRLSKARTSDLFWEAIWPRLLARGWHSEQPDNHNYAVASKNSLVFLVPGVKNDVLGKVASDPELIELETIADNDCTSKEGNGLTKDTKLDSENSADQPRHCCLKVKTPNRSSDVMKFTVVDTSLAIEKMAKVRELRSLPFGVLKACSFENDSDDENSSEEQANESVSVNIICFDRGDNDNTKAKNNASKEELPRSSMGSTSLSAVSTDPKTECLSNAQRRDGMKCQSLLRMASDNNNDLVPVTKRSRLKACSRAKKNSNSANFFVVPRVKKEASFCPDLDNSNSTENVTANFFVAPRVKQEKASYCPNKSKFSENVLSWVVPPQDKSLAGFPTQKNKTLADSLEIRTVSSPNKTEILNAWGYDAWSTQMEK